MTVHELFAHLCVADAPAAIEFYCKAFGATEKLRLTEPSGRIGHVELDFNGSTLLLAGEFPECGIEGPTAGGAASCTIHLHVDNADEVIARAEELGATIEVPTADQFYGERSGSFRDPFGHRWNVGHSIEDVAPDEMQRRYTEMLGGASNDASSENS